MSDEWPDKAINGMLQEQPGISHSNRIDPLQAKYNTTSMIEILYAEAIK